MATLVTKNSSTAAAVPGTGDLVQGELAVNVTDKRLFTKNAGGTVVEVGTNPSTMVVEGNMGVGVTPSAAIAGTTIEVGVNKSGAFGALGSGPVDNAYVSANAYPTGSADPAFTSWKYTRTGFAAKYEAGRGGAHQWFTAPSGTAGNAITFTQAMTLDASGNLGIGTSSPGAKLHVKVGTNQNLLTTSISSKVTNLAVDDAGSGYVDWQQYANQFLWFTASTQRMTLDSSGNLGLGGTPSAWSGVVAMQLPTGAALTGFSNTTNLVQNAYYDGSWRYISAAPAAAALAQVTQGAHQWFTAPSGTAGNTISFTQAMTLDASGDLLVGTTGSYSGNGSRQTVCYDGAGTKYGITLNAVSVTTNATAISFLVNGTTSGSGGTAVGSVTCSGSATAYNTSSDYRLKDNPQPLTGSGAFIDALQPKTWEWKTDGTRGVGFIAHEAQVVSPSSVVGEKDAVDADGKPVMQAMEYGSAEFIANIIAELQSLRARVAALEAA